MEMEEGMKEQRRAYEEEQGQENWNAYLFSVLFLPFFLLSPFPHSLLSLPGCIYLSTFSPLFQPYSSSFHYFLGSSIASPFPAGC